MEPDPGGSWTLDGHTTLAAVSDVTSRQGYLLTFSDRSTANQLRFLFRTWPETAGTYKASADTIDATSVAVSASAGARNYTIASGSSGARVDVVVSRGKLHLSGTGISMQSDSSGAGPTGLSFDLQQF